DFRPLGARHPSGLPRALSLILDSHVFDGLVRTQAPPRRVTQASRTRPLRELDFADEGGRDPDRVASISCRDIRKGARLALPPSERRLQPVEVALAEAGADAADIAQFTVFVRHAEKERADSAAARTGAGAPTGDHDLLGSIVLELDPA